MAFLGLAVLPCPVQADPISGTLYFTTFSGGENVHKLSFSYDGSSTLALGSPVGVSATPGADGLVFTSDGFLAVGGQGAAVYRVNPTTGAFTSQSSGGPAAYHMMVAPDGTIYSSAIPGTPASYNSTLTVNGTPHPLSGPDTAIDTIIWPNPKDPLHAVYTSSGSGGFGNIGFLDLTTDTTTRVASGVPAAHGGTYDPFTNTIIMFGDGHITQFNPTTLAVVSDLSLGGGTFDQGTVDGNGHVFVANNDGNLTFLDISKSGLVGSPDFMTTQFLAGSLDDVAPLSGAGSSTTPEPGSLALLGSAGLILGVYRRSRRVRSMR
jgi:hypothetical protein